MKTKYWIVAAGLLAMPAHADTPASTPANVTVMVNKQQVMFSGAAPIMVGGSNVFVPLRGVFQQLGGKIRWEAATETIIGARPGHEFRIRIGSNQALVDGTPRTLTIAPLMVVATTYVPLRFASEALGASVDWQPDTRTVLINTATR
ncbi:hypothetical protein CCAX7_51190 [Capsulimonas corticalis]|uniref:Copper amine oxidase-like N-terminal domain-containing protein n=1 Tax=Capsulimonas corticalis TaxID=2219043 RepID=A0A402CPC1_9BACT|nr:copper amine oxidase N-terminal domain-containing protein [Capsulimonas corticalis]BDI33068.1 hypothetical protein CCAX7_51190 [Capsulimonas corticalis]